MQRQPRFTRAVWSSVANPVNHRKLTPVAPHVPGRGPRKKRARRLGRRAPESSGFYRQLKMVQLFCVAALHSLELPAGPGGSNPGTGSLWQFGLRLHVAVAGSAQLVKLFGVHRAWLSEQAPEPHRKLPEESTPGWPPLFRQSNAPIQAVWAPLLDVVVGAQTGPELHAANTAPKSGSFEQLARFPFATQFSAAAVSWRANWSRESPCTLTQMASSADMMLPSRVLLMVWPQMLRLPTF